MTTGTLEKPVDRWMGNPDFHPVKCRTLGCNSKSFALYVPKSLAYRTLGSHRTVRVRRLSDHHDNGRRRGVVVTVRIIRDLELYQETH